MKIVGEIILCKPEEIIPQYNTFVLICGNLISVFHDVLVTVNYCHKKTQKRKITNYYGALNNTSCYCSWSSRFTWQWYFSMVHACMVRCMWVTHVINSSLTDGWYTKIINFICIYEQRASLYLYSGWCWEEIILHLYKYCVTKPFLGRHYTHVCSP